jgi:hypothetical protein
MKLQRVVGDGDAEVFGDLAAIEQGADGAADLVGPRNRWRRRSMRAWMSLRSCSVASSRSLRVRSSARAGFLQTTRRVGAPHHYRSDALVGPKLGGR